MPRLNTKLAGVVELTTTRSWVDIDSGEPSSDVVVLRVEFSQVSSVDLFCLVIKFIMI
jgi:hypothetical protein